MSVEEISKRTRSIAKAADRAVPLGININIMYQSLFACIFFMALFSLKPFADFISNLIVRNEKLDFLALRIFDVALLQGASILVVAFAGFVSIKRSGATWTSDSRRIIYPVLVIFAVLFFELLVEKFVLKPTFSFNRPGDSIGEPWLTEALRQIHGSDDDTGTSTPSGFVVRQTILALMFTFIIHQPNFFSSSRYIKLAIFDLLNISTLFFIGALRLYTGAHRLYDIAIGIGLGGFLFWVMTFYLCPSSRK